MLSQELSASMGIGHCANKHAGIECKRKARLGKQDCREYRMDAWADYGEVKVTQARTEWALVSIGLKAKRCNLYGGVAQARTQWAPGLLEQQMNEQERG